MRCRSSGEVLRPGHAGIARYGRGTGVGRETALGLNTGNERPVFGRQRERRGQLTAPEGAVDQIYRVGSMQVFGHALAARHIGQRQTVADEAVQRCSGLWRFLRSSLLRMQPALLAETQQGLFDGRPLLASSHHQQAADPQRIELPG